MALCLASARSLGFVAVALMTAIPAGSAGVLIEVAPFHVGTGTLPIAEASLGGSEGFIGWEIPKDKRSAATTVLLVLARMAGRTAGLPVALHIGERHAGVTVIQYSVATPCARIDGARLYRHPDEETLTLVCLNRGGKFERLRVAPATGLVRGEGATTIGE